MDLAALVDDGEAVTGSLRFIVGVPSLLTTAKLAGCLESGLLGSP